MEQLFLVQQIFQEDNCISKSSKLIFSQFQNQFQNIKIFVEQLKLLQIQITAKEDQQIHKHTAKLISYLSHPRALLNKKLYRNSLVGLGNFLSIKFNFFKRQFLSEKFLKNLMEYFCILCEKQNQKDFNMLIYPIFYFIVLVIYNSDKQISQIFYTNLFTKKFLKALCSVQFNNGNKIQRYLPIIIAFISKGLNSTEGYAQLKQLVLRNLHFSEIEKNQFHYIYSLRVLINKQSFTLSQIRRFELIEHLLNFLSNNKNLEQHVTMILQILKHILKRHQIVGYKMIKQSFLNVMQRSYKISPIQTLNFLQIICPCLPYRYKEKMFISHLEGLQRYHNEKKEYMHTKQAQSLRMINMVVEEMEEKVLMQSLEKVGFESLVRGLVERKLDGEEEGLVVGLLGKMMGRVKKVSLGLWRYWMEVMTEYEGRRKRLDGLLEVLRAQAEQDTLQMEIE